MNVEKNEKRMEIFSHLFGKEMEFMKIGLVRLRRKELTQSYFEVIKFEECHKNTFLRILEWSQ